MKKNYKLLTEFQNLSFNLRWIVNLIYGRLAIVCIIIKDVKATTYLKI